MNDSVIPVTVATCCECYEAYRSAEPGSFIRALHAAGWRTRELTSSEAIEKAMGVPLGPWAFVCPKHVKEGDW